MKIVVLDKCTITNGDISLEEIDSLGDVEYYDMLNDEEIMRVAKDADAIISNKSDIGESIMSSCKKLKYIGLFATGYNNIDLEAADKYGIAVVNVPGYSTDSVAQLAITMILEFATSTFKYNESVQNGDWVRSRTFSYFKYPIMELTGKTLGIYGLGNIGSRVADIGRALGMNVIAYTRTEKKSDFITFVDEKELFKESDFLTFHCPLTDKTKGIVNKENLSLMKKTAFIIDTARGALIVEEDLAEALNNDVIAGAGIDALSIEPMVENHPYLSAKNCVITPHVGWAALETRKRLITLVSQNIKSFFEGNPVNVVNKIEK